MAEEDAYGHWGIAATMIVVSLFFIFRFLPMRTPMFISRRPPSRARRRTIIEGPAPGREARRDS